MSASHYDVVTVGGGLGGAALAMAMAKVGARVLILERETKFKEKIGCVGNFCRRGAWQKRSSSPSQICFASVGTTCPSWRWDWAARVISQAPRRRVCLRLASVILKCRSCCYKRLPVPAPTSVVKRWSRLLRRASCRECRSINRAAVSRQSLRVLWLRRMVVIPPSASGLDFPSRVTRIRFFSRACC